MKLKSHVGLDVASPEPFSANTNPSDLLAHGADGAVELRTRTRILVVDDHPVVRHGLIACLSGRANLIVVGEASDGLDALRKVGELSPDLVLMDVEMPHLNGLAATESICKKFPKTKVLVISMHNNPEYVIQAIHMGARGFALKTAPSEELIKAIEIVQRGEPFFPGQSMTATRPSVRKDPATTSVLFEREKEVLIHLAAGYSNRDIAELLHISVRTVESHRARLMKKLNIHTIAGLTRYALAQGYISLNPEFSLPVGNDDGMRIHSSHGVRV